MNVSIGNQAVDQYTDAELAEWINKSCEGYARQEKTLRVWIAILRAFDEAGPPMTVRQIFYALETRGIIAKTETAYNRVDYHLLQMRRRGLIPYHFISDNTRWMRKPSSYASVEDFLRISQDAYRRALWANQDAYVEVWVEKDALAGVIFEVTGEWDVPLMVTRGFPSETFVYEAAQTLMRQNKPIYLYYFGDYDPSGVSIIQTTRDKLRSFGADFHFEHMAVLPWQITEWNLPTRPTKNTDSRAKNWQGGSVELDAIPVPKLREMVRDVITRHIDPIALAENRHVEDMERETLRQVMNNLGLV